MSPQTALRPQVTPQALNERSRGHLPGLVGMQVIEVSTQGLKSRLTVRKDLFAPNGFLHAAALVALADTTCGYGAIAFLPEGARSFTTLELKASFIGAAKEGQVLCQAMPLNLSRNTQVWDALVVTESDGRRLALFRCTQLILY